MAPRYRYYDLMLGAFVAVLLCSNLIGVTKVSQVGGNPLKKQMNEFLRPRIRLAGLCSTVGILTCGATGVGFLGSIWWALDLTSHFRVQYAVALAGLAIGFAAARKPLPAAAYGLFAAVNLSLILPFYLASAVSSEASGPRLRLVLLNVHTANLHHDRVRSYLLETGPDVILLEEVNDRWIAELEPLKAAYPHVAAAPRADNFGIALFSKIRPVRADVQWIGPTEVPSIVAELVFGGRNVTLVGTHPLPPAGAEYARFRDGQLDAIAEFVSSHPNPVVLVGDLNCTPWSSQFRRLLHRSGLVDSARGFGIQPTWPRQLFPLRIPIDHCLVAPSFRTVRREIGPDVGSDHFPLVVEIVAQP